MWIKFRNCKHKYNIWIYIRFSIKVSFQEIILIKAPFGGYWWLRQFYLQRQRKLIVYQRFPKSCSSLKISRGTKTGQNHRKINTRTLLTENAFAVHSLRLCKGTNLSRQKRIFCRISLIYKRFSSRLFLLRIMQVGFTLLTLYTAFSLV